MALIAVFPTALLVRVLLSPLLHRLPLIPDIFASCVVISFFMSFLTMPWLSRTFQNWLYPNQP